MLHGDIKMYGHLPLAGSPLAGIGHHGGLKIKEMSVFESDWMQSYLPILVQHHPPNRHVIHDVCKNTIIETLQWNMYRTHPLRKTPRSNAGIREITSHLVEFTV